MTQLHILNDLHLKHAPMAPAPLRGDVLVLAGDISDGGDPQAVLELTAHYRKAQRPVVYVLGNHEGYGRIWSEMVEAMHAGLQGSGVALLDDRAAVFGGVRFFGATLWTDYLLLGEDKLADSISMARHFMADHKWIGVKDDRYPKGRRVFDPLDAKAMHEQTVRRMREVLAEPFAGPTVVVSHHAPSPRSIHRQYAGHPANGAFVSNLEPLIEELAPTLWVHGHVHNSMDYRVGATRVVANPRGYPLGRRLGAAELTFENPEFKVGWLIKV